MERIMKRLISLFALAMLVAASAIVTAHEGNEHVRGVVTQVSAQSMTVQTPDNKTRTLAVTVKTTFQRAGKTAQLADLQVGDRVVVDVPEKSSDALLVQIGAAAAATSAKAAPPAKLDVAFKVAPSAVGENNFQVTVKDAAGKAVTDADVSVVVTMPAMPAMKMAAMRTDVVLKPSGAGVYVGDGKLAASGQWNVVVSVKQHGVETAQKKSTVTVR
jgi:hypothetical protein